MSNKAVKSEDEKKRVKKTTVVFVCTGNTCRSPVAQRLFVRELKKQEKSLFFKVHSAGLAANAGDAISEGSKNILKKNKMSWAGHKSKLVTEKIIKQKPYFICMTNAHKQNLLNYIEEKNRVYTIAEIIGGGDVIDPYMGSEEIYQKMFEHLEYAAGEIVQFLLLRNYLLP